MNRERLTRWLVVGPSFVFMVVFFVLPALIMVLASFRFPGEHGGLAPLVEDSTWQLTLEAHAFFFRDFIYIKELTIGNIWLAHGYSNDMFQAQQDARHAGRPFSIAYATPKEGALLALDSMVLHQSGPRPDLAHRFIDFMLDGRNSAELTNLVGSGNPNRDALKYIDPAITANQTVFPPPDVRRRLEMLRDLRPHPAPRAVAHVDGNQGEVRTGDFSLDPPPPPAPSRALGHLSWKTSSSPRRRRCRLSSLGTGIGSVLAARGRG